MAGKRRWGLIILGIVVFVVVVGVGVMATLAYLAFRQIDFQTVATESPEDEFRTVLTQVAGQQPYIELTDPKGGAGVVHREQEKPERSQLTTLHALVWDPEERKVVRVGVPFWLLRLAPGGNVRLSGDGNSGFRIGSDVQLNVTAADIERHGPGLILDHTGHRGERVLLWAE